METIYIDLIFEFDLSVSVFSSGLLSSVLNLSFTHLSLTFLLHELDRKNGPFLGTKDSDFLVKVQKIFSNMATTTSGEETEWKKLNEKKY